MDPLVRIPEFQGLEPLQQVKGYAKGRWARLAILVGHLRFAGWVVRHGVTVNAPLRNLQYLLDTNKLWVYTCTHENDKCSKQVSANP